jgi:hypothetical protein
VVMRERRQGSDFVDEQAPLSCSLG